MNRNSPHMLDKVESFGCTVHGLYEQKAYSDGRVLMGTTWHDVRGALMGDWTAVLADTYRYDALSNRNQDAHLVRVPDIAPLAMAPELLASELAAGRAWQNYALIGGPRFGLFGQPLAGWVWIDEQGARWHVGDGILEKQAHDPLQPLTLELQLRPFGDVGQPVAAPVSISCTLADIGQRWEDGRADAYVYIRFASMSSHGRRALFEIYEADNWGVGRFPVGWLELSLSNILAPQANLAVLKTRTQARGMFFASDATDAANKSFSLPITITYEGRDGQARDVLKATPDTGSVAFIADAAVSRFKVGEAFSERGTTDKIVRVVFDDADNLVFFTVNQLQRVLTNFDEPTLSGWSAPSKSGAIATVDSPPGVSSEWDGDTSYRLRVDFSQTYSTKEISTQTLYRDGAALEFAEASTYINFSVAGEADWFTTLSGFPAGTISPPTLLDFPATVFLTANGVIDAPTVVTRTGYGATVKVNGTVVGGNSSGGSLLYGETYRPSIYLQPSYLLAHPRNPSVYATLTNIQVDARWPTAATRNNVVAGGQYGLRSLNNHLLMSETSDAMALSYKRCRPGAFAAQAAWANPAPAYEYTANVRGTYHPLTHEITLDMAESRGLTFLYI